MNRESASHCVLPAFTGEDGARFDNYQSHSAPNLPENPGLRCLPSPALSLALDAATDEALMADAVSGEQRALETLITRHSKLIASVIFGILHNKTETEEVLIEVFLTCWNNRIQYSPKRGKLLGWLVTVARRRGIDRLRKRQRYSAFTERLQMEANGAARSRARSHGVNTSIEQADIQRFVQAQVNELPAFQRAAIEFAFYQGMSQSEIALQTGIPLGTIKTRIKLALKKLAIPLKPLWDSN